MNDNLLKVKIDTKEKMHVITLEESVLAANMTEGYKQIVLPFLQKHVKNLIINFINVVSIDLPFAIEMVNVQKLFYEENVSMVFCNISREVSKFLDENDLFDLMNVTPTESEAWDIVQMEEIEREFL